MDVLKNLIKRKNNPLINIYKEYEKEDKDQLALAIDGLLKVRDSSKDQEEYMDFLLEDIIFSSLYATFYECLLISLKENQNLSIELIDNFHRSAKEREQIISNQTFHHFEYIRNDGTCDGCPSCANHEDVDEILLSWKQKNKDFFENLYLTMTSIQYVMEKLIYNTLPEKRNLVLSLSEKNILELRQYIFKNLSKKLKDDAKK